MESKLQILTIISCIIFKSCNQSSKEVLLFYDDFSDLNRGPLSTSVGAHTEYHYLPEAALKGHWAVSNDRGWWSVRGEQNEQFELKADQTIPALMLFAGGIAGKGETCGAVSGSLLAIGFFFESINQKEMEKAGSSVKYGGLFFDRFTKEFGSTRCKEVVKHQYGRYYDFGNPEEQKLFMEESQKSGKCMEVIKKAVLIAGEIILENS